MRILLAPAGTSGDFRPLLALAVELRRRGHQTLLASAPGFAAEAAAFGIDFRCVGRDIEAVTQKYKELGGFLGVRAFKRLLNEELCLQFEGLRVLCTGFDRIVGAGAQMAGRSIAQAAGIPYRYVAYAPDIFPSRSRPLELLSWSLGARYVDWALRTESGRMQQALGLPRIRSHLAHFFPPRMSILAADPELAPVPRDLDIAATVGAIQALDHRAVPAEVVQFIEAGEPPLYIGFGSVVDPDPQATTAIIVEAMRLAQCRFLLSSGWGKLGGVDLGSRGLLVDEVNFTRLLPKVAAVVHHGGAGTTAAVARAGIPQLVIPHIFDQYAWARRVHRRGLGPRPFNRPRLTAARLARSVCKMLTDQRMHARAQDLARILATRDGLDAAVQRVLE